MCWPTHTLLFPSQTRLSDLILKLSALPAHTRLDLTYRDTAWEVKSSISSERGQVSRGTGLKQQQVQTRDLKKKKIVRWYLADHHLLGMILSLSVSVSLCLCLSVCLPARLSVCLFVCLSLTKL